MRTRVNQSNISAVERAIERSHYRSFDLREASAWMMSRRRQRAHCAPKERPALTEKTRGTFRLAAVAALVHEMNLILRSQWRTDFPRVNAWATAALEFCAPRLNKHFIFTTPAKPRACIKRLSKREALVACVWRLLLSRGWGHVCRGFALQREGVCERQRERECRF